MYHETMSDAFHHLDNFLLYIDHCFQASRKLLYPYDSTNFICACGTGLNYFKEQALQNLKVPKE